jgi:hypothetical protein
MRIEDLAAAVLDLRDVLTVQGPESLDLEYVERWCELHGTLGRLREALAEIPPLD